MESGSVYDIVVIGAGIVGLATALKLLEKKPKLKLLLVDKESSIGFHQTSHNSGVIHAGLYYKPGSKKAKLSRLGRKLMVDFCDEHRIKYELCGKLVVATREDQVESLEKLWLRGNENGLRGLAKLCQKEIREIEPHCLGLSGIHVPEEGIVDFKDVAMAMFNCLSAKCDILLSSKLVSSKRIGSSFDLGLLVAGEPKKISCKNVITCGGLQSDRLVKIFGHQSKARIIPFAGHYFSVGGESVSKLRNLIYPVPNPEMPFLGVHLTRTTKGVVEAGPNAVLSLDRESYKRGGFNAKDTWETFSYPGFWRLSLKYMRTGVSEFYRTASKRAFFKACGELVDGIQLDDLSYLGCGVRAQAVDKHGNMIDDFEFVIGEGHMHVVNAPSPAATASLAIGCEISSVAVQEFKL